MKVAFLDIETTNLNADVGFILCAGYKLAGEKKVRMTRIDDDPNYRKCLFNDTVCVKQIYDWIAKDDIDFLVTYNGDMFDLPYVNSRLLKIKHKGLPPFRSIDHWKTSRYKLKLHRFSLDALAKHLGVPDQKTWFDLKVWQKAAYGHKSSLDNIVHHCDLDVKVLEQCHDKVVPLLRSLRGIY